MSSKILRYLIPCFLILLTLFTRFYKLDWGNGYYFHPDENNMASSVLQMNFQNLNPHFFAYGQFPLYLTFLTTPIHDFNSITLILRFWSAIFSCFSVLFFYLVGKNIFKSQTSAFIFTLLIIFTPGFIQLSHFGTTESILIFVFIINIYLSLKISNKFKLKYLILASLISGIGLATKISTAFFILPISFSLFPKFKKLIIFILLTLLFFFVFSPYNFIDFSSFLSSMKYEIGVASGQIPVFYTHQFISTVPYFFQFQKIFPYTNGIPILIFSLFGLFFLPRKSKKYLLVIIPSLIFFLYQGQLFVKWTRFMAPIFFIFPFLSIYFLEKIKVNFFKIILIIIAILPGIYFLKTYSKSDIRVQASDWINQNIPQNSKVISESGNVINIPIKDSNFDITNFDFYQFDQNQLDSLVKKSDYIFIPSRRVFMNNFSQTQDYYSKLFSNQLGFSQIKYFFNNNSLFLNSEKAEETWSVFDNPTIRIFQKNNL